MTVRPCENVDDRSLPPGPLISVIVPIRDRSGPLESLLGALAVQTLPRAAFEVLVCDDGSTEDIAGCVERARRECQLPVRILRQEPRGPGAARNLGIAHAEGEILAFTDSDCEPDPDWLEQIAAALADPHVALIGGVVGFHRGVSLLGRCTNYLMSTSLGAAGARDPRCPIRMSYLPRTPNMAVRRAAALEAGGFPETRYGEDIVFSARVAGLGPAQDRLVRFCPECVVSHNEVRTFGQVAREAYEKGRTRVRLTRDHGMHELVHAMPALLVVWCLLCGVTWGIAPVWAGVGSLPLAVYAVWLVATAGLGAWALGRPAAAPWIVFLAPTMHAAYGCGYLAARLGIGESVRPGTARQAAPGTARDGSVSDELSSERLREVAGELAAVAAILGGVADGSGSVPEGGGGSGRGSAVS
jgi:GT2 family glycosyltransferase